MGPKIAIWAGSGIGGTEKAATLFATSLAARGVHVYFLGDDGPRSACLREAGVHMCGHFAKGDDLAEFIRDKKFDVLHQHVPGYPITSPVYEAMKRLGNQPPKLIETNVFGRLEDLDGLPWVNYRMFVSKTSAIQAFKRAKLPLNKENYAKHTVLSNPLPDRAESKSSRQEIRTELGVGPEDILIIRIGRPGNKWSRWECEAFASAGKKNKNLRLLLMEPPPDIWNDVSHGKYGEGIIVRKITSDFDWLNSLYHSADIGIHSAAWGESFGYTIAESMAAGLPMITMSTPWGDNCQIELVENGKTGFVCGGPHEMSRRLEEFAENKKLAMLMGAEGKDRVQKVSNIDRETDILEAVIETVLTGKEPELLVQRREDLVSFGKTFAALESFHSEAVTIDPLDKIYRSFYKIYRKSRAIIRNERARIRHYALASI